MNRWFSRVWLLILLVLMLAGAGCQPAQPVAEPVTALPPANLQLPSYQQLVESYNRRIANLDRIWSRAVVEVRWVDQEGNRHFEQGDDSKFIAILPNHLAMTMGKAGQVFLWAGADKSRYWLLDLRDARKAYVGTEPVVAQPTGQTGSPLIVDPRDLPLLMGLLPLDPDAMPPAPAVEWARGLYLIEPPGTRSRIVFDSRTLTPVRIDLLDQSGRTVVIAQHADPELVELAGVSMGAWPRIASRYTITFANSEDRLLLRLNDMSDGRAGNRINKSAFDLDLLLRAHRIPPEQVIDLDKQ